MMKKIMSVIVSVCLVFTAMSSAVMAAKSSFSDVTSPAYDWAIDAIESMTREGIIKGYSDYTFRPSNSIKKIEMLLLLARTAQFQNDDYALFAEFASRLYEPVLAKYDLGETYNNYKPEVAFLLYKGIISADELDSLLGAANEELARYEAAVLLTKLMGAEAQVRANIAPVLDYRDFSAIPVQARAYVEYVTEMGIMNGVDANNFGPMGKVSRAQAAVILYRVMNIADYSTRVGFVESIDVDDGTITLYDEATDRSADISVNFKNVKITKDGKNTTINNVSKGNYGLALYSGKTVVSLEFLSSLDYAGTNAVYGTIADIDIAPEFILGVLLSDDTYYSYEVSSNATITRNDSPAGLRDLLVGDSVSITEANGIVFSIAATSSPSSASGIISSIHISAAPRLGVKANGEDNDYPVSPNATFNVDGSDATIYDLRLGSAVELGLEGSSIVSVNASSEAPTYQIFGNIIDLNLSYGVISVDRNNSVEQVFLTMNGEYIETAIIDSLTGDKIDATELESGLRVMIVGNYANGTFIAATIIILPE